MPEIRAKTDETPRLQFRLEQALAQWADMSCRVPDHEGACHLIESF
jgi:hypothetical protein